MKKSKLFLSPLCIVTLALGIAGTASAAMLDSADFTWKYEFEGAAANTPDNLDIDGNSSPDMMLYGTAGTVAGGVLTMTSGAYIDDYGWKPELTNGIWKANSFDVRYGFTIEARIKVISDSGLEGATSIVASPDDPTSAVANHPDSWMNIWGSRMTWDFVGNSAYRLLSTEDNTDDFHVFRLGMNPDTLKYAVWRDGVLLADDLDDVYADLTGLDRLLLGDLSGSIEGTTDWDYIRLTEGYYAPVPEPATLSLLLLGGGAAVMRRRR